MAGDPACWLSEVCEECGRISERPELVVCENCGHPRSAGPADRAVTDRDRDDAGRARNSRPRDGLGRPLPYGSTGVDRAPEGVRRSPEDTLAEAQRLLDAGLPFHAHEVLEDAWKLAEDRERALWRGLAQLAVGLTHAMRGNPSGASALLLRGADNLALYRRTAPYAVDAEGLMVWAQKLAADVESNGDGTPDAPRAPQLRARQQRC